MSSDQIANDNSPIAAPSPTSSNAVLKEFTPMVDNTGSSAAGDGSPLSHRSNVIRSNGRRRVRNKRSNDGDGITTDANSCSSSGGGCGSPSGGILVAHGRFCLTYRIGGGSFGEVFGGYAVNSGRPVAAKIERITAENKRHLGHEAKMYMYFFKKLPQHVGLPKLMYFGRQNDFYILVNELLGPNLGELFQFCGKKFSLKTVLMLARQMVDRLELIHSLHHVHRDMKPENWAMGIDARSHVVYLLDFGLAKRYRESDGHHAEIQMGKNLVGTARYVSINTHLGISVSRRDDVESMLYVLLFLCLGKLPWQNVHSTVRAEKYERIKAAKLTTSIDSLCSNAPSSFKKILQDAKELPYTSEPRYAFYRTMIEEDMKKEGFAMDYVFCWTEKHAEEEREMMETLVSVSSSGKQLLTSSTSKGNIHSSSPFIPGARSVNAAAAAGAGSGDPRGGGMKNKKQREERKRNTSKNNLVQEVAVGAAGEKREEKEVEAVTNDEEEGEEEKDENEDTVGTANRMDVDDAEEVAVEGSQSLSQNPLSHSVLAVETSTAVTTPCSKSGCDHIFVTTTIPPAKPPTAVSSKGGGPVVALVEDDDPLTDVVCAKKGA